MIALGNYILLRLKDSEATARDSGLLLSPIREYEVMSLGSNVDDPRVKVSSTVIIADESLLLSNVSIDTSVVATIIDNIIAVV